MANDIKSKKVCVVGLGYVGLPLLLLLAEKGYRAHGFDIKKELIDSLKKSKSSLKDKIIENKLKKVSHKLILSNNQKILNEADIITVCVPTPINKNHKPDLTPLKSACLTISNYIKKGQLIIIESTTFPATIDEIIIPILQKSNLIVGKDFHLAYCPERIDPGNKKYDVSNIPRVIAGTTKKCRKKAYEFYIKLIDAPIMQLSSTKSAEATKMVENIFRDVNIALANELAKSFDKMGIDIIEVIKGASTKPFAFLPHYPGCGVGGHCIPVDPYYLIEKARMSGFNHKFLSLARQINESMPDYTVKKTMEGLKEIGKKSKEAKVVILGLAYKPNISDTRESPSFKIINRLKKLGVQYDIYDPYVLNESTVKNLELALKNKDCVILATNHSQFRNIPIEKFKKNKIKIMVDGRNCLDKNKFVQEGIIYKGIGR